MASFQDIHALEERIYDAVQDYLDNPEGYTNATLHVYLDKDEMVYRAEMGLGGWIECFDKSELKGHVFCGGVDGPREIDGNAKLKEAYEMGKKV